MILPSNLLQGVLAPPPPPGFIATPTPQQPHHGTNHLNVTRSLCHCRRPDDSEVPNVHLPVLDGDLQSPASCSWQQSFEQWRKKEKTLACPEILPETRSCQEKSEVEFEYHQVGARWGPKQPVLNGGRKPRYRIITADNPSIKASIGVFHPIYSWLLGAPLNGTKNWATKTPYAWHESCFQKNDLFFAWSMTKMIWVCLHDR